MPFGFVLGFHAHVVYSLKEFCLLLFEEHRGSL